MSESDGKDWPITTKRDAWIKRAVVEALAHYEECEAMDRADLVTMAMERAWDAARSAAEGEANEASRAAFVAARRKTLADAIVLRCGAPGGSGWEGARYDADGNAASTVGHADPLVVLAAVLGLQLPQSVESESGDDVLRARERGVAEGWTRYRQGAIVLRHGMTPEGDGWLVSRYADNGDPVGSAHDLNPLRAVEHVLGAGELPRVDLAGYGGHLAGIRDKGPCPSARPDSHERCWYRKGHAGRHWAPGVEWTDEQAEAHDLRQLEISKAREDGEAGALAKLQQTTHARLAESGALDRASEKGYAEGFARALAYVEAEADGYRRRAQAIRVEAEVAEAKADALAGAVAAIRREVAP